MNYQSIIEMNYQPIIEMNIRGEIIHEYRSDAAMAKAVDIPKNFCHALVTTCATFQESKKDNSAFLSSPILDENIEMDVFALPQIFKGRKVG